MTLRVVGTLPESTLAQLTSVERLRSLEDVLAWCRLHASDVVDVIVQDEYTHDVLVCAPELAFLVFDTT